MGNQNAKKTSRRRRRAANTLVGEYVENRAQMEENLRLETHRKRKEILKLERAAAEIHLRIKQQELEHKQRMNNMAEEKE